MFVPPNVHPGFLQQEARPFGEFTTDRSSSGSWGTQFSEGEAFSSSGQAEPDFKGERGSPLSHFQALEQVSLASLRLDDRASMDDNRFAQQHGEQQSVGWGGRPLQHQQRFKQQRGEEYGYHQMQRRGPHYPRGKQPAPNQRPTRGGHDGRVKNQGYRRLWQQVTQVTMGGGGGTIWLCMICTLQTAPGARRCSASLWHCACGAPACRTRLVPPHLPRRRSGRLLAG